MDISDYGYLSSLLACDGRPYVMAIDPKAPVTPVLPVTPPGGAADASKVLLALAMARAAAASGGTLLGEIVGGTEDSVIETAQASTTPGHAAKPDLHHTDTGSMAPTAVAERAVAAARSTAARAASSQSGLAPMMADLAVAITRPEVPKPVRQAAQAVLDQAIPSHNPVSAGILRQAMQGSGVFLEARLAQTPSAGATLTAPPDAPEMAGRDMKAALLVFKAVVGTWLAEAPVAPGQPAASRVATGSTTQAAYTPASAGGFQPSPPAAVLNVQTAAVSGGAPLEAADQALVASRSAAPPSQQAPSTAVFPPPATPAGPASTSGPIVEIQREAPAPESDATPAPQQAEARPAQVASTQPLLMVGMIEEEVIAAPEEEGAPPPGDDGGSLSRGRDVPLMPRSAPPRPPPPYAGGPTTAQAATVSDLPVNMPAAELARRLLKSADGALARQELMQIASLPEGRGEAETVTEARSQRWVFDLPFQTPQGVAVAQFEVSRDGGGGGSDGGPVIEKTWRARFSIDVEPLGPVHVQVALTGARTRVGLWAERPEAMMRLKAGEDALSAALREAELTPELAFHPGSPVVAPVERGHFVDRAS